MGQVVAYIISDAIGESFNKQQFFVKRFNNFAMCSPPKVMGWSNIIYYLIISMHFLVSPCYWIFVYCVDLLD